MRGAVPKGVAAPRGEISVTDIADVDAQHIGKARADGDAVLTVEPVEAAEADVVGDKRQRACRSFLAHAAHERAGGRHGRWRP